MNDYTSSKLIRLFGKEQIVGRMDFFTFGDENAEGEDGVYFLGLTRIYNPKKKVEENVLSLLVWFPKSNQGDIYLDIIANKYKKMYKNLAYEDLMASFGKIHKSSLSFDEVIDVIKKQDPKVWFSDFNALEESCEEDSVSLYNYQI